MPGVIFRAKLEPELTMVALTERFEALTGHPVRALIDGAERSYASLVHPDDRAMVLAAAADVGQHQTSAEIEYRLQTREGAELWVRQEIWPAAADAMIEGFIIDVSEARRMQRDEVERQLAHAAQQRCLVELATHPSVADGRFEELSRVATERVAELVGVERTSVWMFDDDGQRLELAELFIRSEVARSEASQQPRVALSARDYPAYFEALRGGRSIDAHAAIEDPRTREFAEIYLRPLGIVALLDAAIRVGGKVVGVVCLEHVGDERRWQKHEIEFAGEVADQLSLALLNRARLAAQAEQDELRAQLFQSQKMDALGRLAGGVAHDFNNVLMAISGNAEILALSLEDPLLLRSAKEIVDASFRAGELIGHLLRFARREPLELRTIDFGATVGELQTMLRRLLGKRLRFEVRIADAPICVRATESLVQQVLTNLVVNARDALHPPSDGVVERGTIVVEVDTCTKLDVLEPGEHALTYARLQVSDDGVGMDPDVQAKVFEPFFTTKEPGKGTGLGLATVYSIVRRCGGQVGIDSAPGRGTTVSVLLPLVESAPLER